MFKSLFDYLQKLFRRDWRKEKVKCCSCGHTWNCIFPNVKNGETKLECPKCGKRNSMVVTK